MRSDLDHLPLRQRNELRRILDILFAEFAETLKSKLSPERKKGRILKVILYGSHARGDWVIDRVNGYISDFDLLVVVDGEEFTDFEYWERAEERFGQLSLVHPLRPSPSLIVHSLAEVNDHLAHGRYFFMDILREGIVLYETERHPFVDPQPLEPEIARAEEQRSFDYWFPLAQNAPMVAKASLDNGVWRDAAFLYHQAVERLYHCVLLVLTLYTPKLHDIEKLRKLAEPLDARLIEAWPRNTRQTRRLFQKLRRAYVDARYSPQYDITTEELAWIEERIAVLQGIVRTVCQERLAQLVREPGEGREP